ncbi:hypothetical protein C8R46DRAFT_1230711 [Mycena filopes]|nr:hypothetical protein C8R46DRAFT_1230711 [Mycena filopes]
MYYTSADQHSGKLKPQRHTTRADIMGLPMDPRLFCAPNFRVPPESARRHFSSSSPKSQRSSNETSWGPDSSNLGSPVGALLSARNPNTSTLRLRARGLPTTHIRAARRLTRAAVCAARTLPRHHHTAVLLRHSTDKRLRARWAAHLAGPPLDVALDTRGRRNGEGTCVGEDESKIHLGILETRALKEGEEPEIVVGWRGTMQTRFIGWGRMPAAPTPMQRHLIAQLANILHTLGDAECACTPLAAATPAAPAHAPLPPAATRAPVLGDRRPVDRQEEEEGDGEVDGVERACVILAIEGAVVPPIELSFTAGHGHTDGEELDVDIDIEGEETLPMRGGVLLLRPVGPYTVTGRHVEHTRAAVIRRVFMPPAASIHPQTSSSSSFSASGSRRTRTRKRLAGPGVPPPSPAAPDQHPFYGSRNTTPRTNSVILGPGMGTIQFNLVLDSSVPQYLLIPE